MKKITALILGLFVCFGVFGCTQEDPKEGESTDDTSMYYVGFEEESSGDVKNDVPALEGDVLSEDYVLEVKNAFGKDVEVRAQTTDKMAIITISNADYSNVIRFYANCVSYGMSPLFEDLERSTAVGISFGDNMLKFMRSAGSFDPMYIVGLTLDSNDPLYSELLAQYNALSALSMYGTVTIK